MTDSWKDDNVDEARAEVICKEQTSTIRRVVGGENLESRRGVGNKVMRINISRSATSPSDAQPRENIIKTVLKKQNYYH